MENEKHKGDALLQKTYQEGFKKKKNYGEVPQYYVENNHEPIVSRELFDTVQALREKRRAAIKQSPIKLSPFSGKIKCTECGRGYMHRKNNRNTPYEKWIWSCCTYIHSGRQYCGGKNIREEDLKAIFLGAYNEAAQFVNREAPAVNLSDCLKALLAQERDLIGIKARGYITREAFAEQHSELLRQIKETESVFIKEAQRSDSKKYDAAREYDDGLVANLEVAEIDGYTITFNFRNGAKVKRGFNNDTNRKETWERKLRRAE